MTDGPGTPTHRLTMLGEFAAKHCGHNPLSAAPFELTLMEYILELKRKQEMTNMIWVKFSKEGIHKYPAAATDPALAEVSFLGYPHRHIFQFKVWIEIFHDDRDIEFILFKRWLESLFADGILQLDYKSCEMISDDLHKVIEEKHPGRAIWISVSEDDENGSYKQYGAAS